MLHYRYADRLEGPWIEPENDLLDGRSLYAAKTAGTNEQRFLCGWIPEKDPAKNSGQWEWGGNLGTLELVQAPDKTLQTRLPQAVFDLFTPSKAAAAPTELVGSAAYADGVLTLQSSPEKSGAFFGTAAPTMLIEADLTFSEGTKYAGLALAGAGDALSQSLGINFDLTNGQMEFAASTLDYLKLGEAAVRLPLKLRPGQTVHVKFLIENDICNTYVDDVIAMSNRIYGITGAPWGFYAWDGGLTVENCSVSILESETKQKGE